MQILWTTRWSTAHIDILKVESVGSRDYAPVSKPENKLWGWLEDRKDITVIVVKLSNTRGKPRQERFGLIPVSRYFCITYCARGRGGGYRQLGALDIQGSRHNRPGLSLDN
jgi:hypothetical protein